MLLCRLSNETTFYKRLLSVLLSIKVLCSIYQSVHLQSAEAVKWSTRLGSIYRVASMFTVGWRKRNLHWTDTCIVVVCMRSSDAIMSPSVVTLPQYFRARFNVCISKQQYKHKVRPKKKHLVP